MVTLVSKTEYEQQTAATRDSRMAWWREARFGMFVTYGLYSQLGSGEWAMTAENIPVEEYEALAQTFLPKPGAPREWAALAKKAMAPPGRLALRLRCRSPQTLHGLSPGTEHGAVDAIRQDRHPVA